MTTMAPALAVPAGTAVAARVSPEIGSLLFNLFNLSLAAVVLNTRLKERRHLELAKRHGRR